MSTGRKRVAVLISGRGSNMTALVEAAKAPDYPGEIVAVFADRADAAGLMFCRNMNIPAQAFPRKDYSSKSEHEASFDAALAEAGVEFVCLAGFMRLLTPEFTERHAGRLLNIHPSLLPKFPGLDTHARAIAANEREHGCTVHFVTAEMDAGPIVAQSRVPILPGDTPDALSARVLQAEHALYPRALAMVLRGEATFPAA